MGEGEEEIGIEELKVKDMKVEGKYKEDEREKIWMVEIDGIMDKKRKEGKIEGKKILYEKENEVKKDMRDVVKEIKK
jgi:hypothetical protein